MKRAAQRKLEHELGIPPEDVPLDCFTWITRVHYVGERCAGRGGGRVSCTRAVPAGSKA